MIQFENDELICCIDPDFLNLPDYAPQIKDKFSLPVPRKCGQLDQRKKDRISDQGLTVPLLVNLDNQSTQDEEDVDANTGADEDSEDESELSEVESEFEYEQNEEMNDILIQKLNKEIELEIERERDFQM